MDRTAKFFSLYHKSVKHAWNLESLISRDWAFNFDLHFMPDPVTLTKQKETLDPLLQLRLSQIRGNEYLSIIIFIEDVIIDFLWNYVGKSRYALPHETQQALTNFISEEMKHTLLFQSFRTKFEQGFGRPCRVLDRMESFIQFVLKYDSLGVLLFVLHGEVMTYSNYLSSVRNSTESLDPFFSEVLRYHWIEESSHVQLDELLLQEMLETYDEKRTLNGIKDYFRLIDFLYGAFRRAGEFDLENLFADHATHEAAMDCRRQLVLQQKRFYVQSYILDVMESPQFRKSFRILAEPALSLLDEKIGFLKGTLNQSA